MATIKYVTTPDGVTHNIGGGGTVVTYSISLGAVSSNTVPIILTGSNGTTDTVYVKGGGDATMSVSGDTMTITATSGQTITYTLSGSGTTTTYTITNTPSSGTASSVTIPAATTSAAGLMTSSDKSKLDGIASGAEVNVQSDWNQSDSTADDYIKNKPTIPTVNNGQLTIQKNGTTVSTFTANQSGNATANITVPTATSELTNDSDFVSDASYVHTDNNFTNAYVTKLNGIESGAEVNVQSDWDQTDNTADDFIKNKPSIPTKTSDLTNDSNFVSDANYVHTDNNFTTTLKNKLNGIEAGAEVNVQADWAQSDSTADDYIKNKPAIPTKTSDLTNDSNFVSDASYVHTDNNFTTTLKNKLDGIESGAEVNVQADWNEADSSSDAYIKNKPTIPSVGDGTLTIQKNGSTIDTFTANQSSNTTVNVTVPTATSDLTNDSDFVSDASYVHTDNNFTTTLKNKLNGIQAGAEVNVQSDWNQSDSTADDYIKNKPTLATVATSGDYDDLTNKPTIPSVSVTQKTTTGTNIADITINGTTTELYAPSGGGGNVQADWTEANPSADSYIQNKPTTVSITPVTKKTVVTGGTTTSITPVTKKTVVTGVTPATVVTGGSTTGITPVTSKTVVTSASGATATVSIGVLTLTDGSFGTGASVTSGTTVNAYTSLSTGSAASVSTGDSVTEGTAVNVYTSLTTGDSVTEGTAVNVYKS